MIIVILIVIIITQSDSICASLFGSLWIGPVDGACVKCRYTKINAVIKTKTKRDPKALSINKKTINTRNDIT